MISGELIGRCEVAVGVVVCCWRDCARGCCSTCCRHGGGGGREKLRRSCVRLFSCEAAACGVRVLSAACRLAMSVGTEASSTRGEPRDVGLPGVGELGGRQSSTKGSVDRGASGRMLWHASLLCSLSRCSCSPKFFIREASLSEPRVGLPPSSVTITSCRLMIKRSCGCVRWVTCEGEEAQGIVVARAGGDWRA